MNANGQKILDEISTELPADSIPETSDPTKKPVDQAPVADGKMLTPAFRSMADSIAPNWKISDDECKGVGLAAEVFITETWGGLDKLPPWLTLVITVGMVVVPRLGTPLRLEEKPVNPEPEKAEA